MTDLETFTQSKGYQDALKEGLEAVAKAVEAAKSPDKGSRQLGVMTANQFKAHLKRLRLSVYASAPALGISLRTAQRYASGESRISLTVAKLVRLMDEKNG